MTWRGTKGQFLAIPFDRCHPHLPVTVTGFGHENNIAQSWELEHPELMGLPVGEKTIADRLKAAGYRTACIGKWHLGVHDNFHPQARGFDEFFGFLEGGRAYLSDDDPENFYYKSTPPFKQIHFKQGTRAPIYRGREVVAEKESLTDAFTREAIRFIDANKAQPFFLYLAFNAVHTPITPCARTYPEANAGWIGGKFLIGMTKEKHRAR